MRVIMLSLCALVLLPLAALAQTVKQVPYGEAHIYWDAPVDPPSEGSGVTRWHLLNCGASDIRIELPATSIAVKDVVPAPGQYTCNLWAANDFGKSLPASVPVFEAGSIPATPQNVRIDAQ